MLQETKVGLGFSPEELPDDDSLLQSKLLPTEIMKNYRAGATKLTRELQSIDFADHLWKLKTYDQHGMVVVKIFCGECNKDCGGSSGEHSRYHGIQNLFTNFKKSHLHLALHIKHWCKKRDILYSDHPKKEGNSSKPVVYTTANHRYLVDEGVSTFQSVNDSISSNNPPFVVVGDVGVSRLKSFWFKVCCKINEELMYLCLQKRNLRANLENHFHGLLHTKCCEDQPAASSSSKRLSALSSGKRGRPTARSRLTIGNQRDLHSWFSNSGSAEAETSSEAPSGLHSDSIFSLLC